MLFIINKIKIILRWTVWLTAILGCQNLKEMQPQEKDILFIHPDSTNQTIRS